MLLLFGGSSTVGSELTKIANDRGEDVIAIQRRELNNREKIINIQGDLAKESYSIVEKIRETGKDKLIKRLIFCQRYRPDKKGEYSAHDELDVHIFNPERIINMGIDKWPCLTSIICISSIAASQVADEQCSGYHIVRSGLESMIRKASIRGSEKDIAINTIRLGYVKNRGDNTNINTSHELDKLTVPRKYAPDAKEVARAVDKISRINTSVLTGQTITLDAGLTLMTQSSLAVKLMKALEERS